jgi:hypothetical protein
LLPLQPFENYLADDGKPEIKTRNGRKSGKPTKRDLSLNRFCKGLGYAPSLESSGDITRSRVSGGSDLCRKALWQWIFTRIEPQRARFNNDMGSWLGEIMDAEKLSRRSVRLVRSRVAAKAVKLLFKELVHELVYCKNPSIKSEMEHKEFLE